MTATLSHLSNPDYCGVALRSGFEFGSTGKELKVVSSRAGIR